MSMNPSDYTDDELELQIEKLKAAQNSRARAKATNEKRALRATAIEVVEEYREFIEKIIKRLDDLVGVHFLIIDWDKGTPELNPDAIHFGIFPVKPINGGTDFDRIESATLGRQKGKTRNLEAFFKAHATDEELKELERIKSSPDYTTSQIGNKTYALKKKVFDREEAKQSPSRDPRTHVLGD